jgi:hypothetical protein
VVIGSSVTGGLVSHCLRNGQEMAPYYNKSH